ncbi:hypothetical protein FE257_004065 [Aspergillus nanangensis]|uniref:Restriction of telomere capping protein 4 n=1 Tax=Aspergillus nanangensis TaxID=2582783 RepID=A0AAD4CB12_ASPNN|nr:hypothetical protein FE257_004065 [Aspergillus nanangensis]
MVLRAKPNSSYASTRLTRHSTREHLLSTFKNNTPDLSSSKPEPATDDEPVSSEEEIDNDADLNQSSEDDERKPRLPTESLREKLAKVSQQEGKGKDPKSNLKRDSRQKRWSDIMSTGPDGNDEEDIFGMVFSQGSKRRKTLEYPSRNSRKSETYIKTPSSSISAESQSPPSSDRKTNKSSSRKSKKGDDKPASRTKGFKMPMEIDIRGPPAKSRPELEFKVPGFADATSSSSFVTSSAQIFDDDSAPGTPLSSLSSSVVDAMLEEADLTDDGPEKITPEQSVCPWCKEPVDPESLMMFQAQPKQRIREQRRFCESHHQATAKIEWQEKGYPDIDWVGFDERIQALFPVIENILVSGSNSYYRNILETMLKSSQSKTFRLTLEGDGLETISCGYYGTRGAGKMLQALTTRFSRTLRRLAASDHIIKNAGVVGYTQAVLVPELAVRLVREDMGVNAESARVILRESMDIGEQLNFALNDEVPLAEEDDEVI